MEGFKTLHDHNGSIYTTNLLRTFARLGIPKITSYYSYGWGYDPGQVIEVVRGDPWNL